MTTFLLDNELRGDELDELRADMLAEQETEQDTEWLERHRQLEWEAPDAEE